MGCEVRDTGKNHPAGEDFNRRAANRRTLLLVKQTASGQKLPANGGRVKVRATARRFVSDTYFSLAIASNFDNTLFRRYPRHRLFHGFDNRILQVVQLPSRSKDVGLVATELAGHGPAVAAQRCHDLTCLQIKHSLIHYMPLPLTPPTVLILASGRGERFKASGGSVHKLQALLAGKPVLLHTLDAVRASGLPWHLEDAGHPGMGDSIAAAVRQTVSAAGWLVLPGDLPLVQPATLRAMAQVLLDQRAVVAWPEFAGERGHPVAFGRDCLEGLLALSGEKGAAPVVRHWEQLGRGLAVPVQDEGVVSDIDTVQALQRAEALLAKTQVHRDAGGR